MRNPGNLSRRERLNLAGQYELRLPATTTRLVEKEAREARQVQATFHRNGAVQLHAAAMLDDQSAPKAAD